MKTLSHFIKTTLVGGLLVLFPLFCCLYLGVRIAAALTNFTKPLLGFLPQNRFIGVAIADAASVLILLLVCFATGLIARTAFGSSVGLRTSEFLNRIPGYRMLDRIARIIFDHEDQRGSPVVLRNGDTKQIGFLVEENSAEELTVFFPNAPTPFSGNIAILRADDVERLDVPRSEVLRMIASFGAGTRELLVDRKAK
jgi:uncharacterized membrane protein